MEVINRKANHDYFIKDRYEVGIELKGTEIKSIRKGSVNINDVTAIQRHFAELDELTEEQLALADTNGDGEINIDDATHLQMYLAEYDVVLGKQSTT